MFKHVLELFRVTEERANELFLMFVDSDGSFADAILKNVHKAKIPIREKMFMSYVLGVMSLVEVQEPPTLLKSEKKTYIH